MLKKPKDIRRRRDPVQYPDGPEGRMVCDLTTAEGRREYERSKDIMYAAQKGMCLLGPEPHWIPRREATFEHSDGRTAGHRNDSPYPYERNGVTIQNQVACGFHNGAKGSRRSQT